MGGRWDNDEEGNDGAAARRRERLPSDEFKSSVLEEQ